MEIGKSSRPGLIICTLDGKFDIEQTEKFENYLNQILSEKPPQIGIDLSNVDYIDSSAIGSIIKLLNLIKNYGGDMFLFGLKPMILNVFRLAKLDNFFKILSTDEFDRQFPD